MAAGGQGPPAIFGQALEASEIEFVPLDSQAIAGRAAHEPPSLAAERASQSRDHRSNRLDRPLRRPLTPEVRDHPIARDGVASPQQEHGEQCPLPRTGHAERPTFDAYLNRTQDAEIHTQRIPPTATAVAVRQRRLNRRGVRDSRGGRAHRDLMQE